MASTAVHSMADTNSSNIANNADTTNGNLQDAAPATGPADVSHSSAHGPAAPPKAKRGRKKKDPDDKEEPQKKTRRPRVSKTAKDKDTNDADKPAPSSRKKPKLEHDGDPIPGPVAAARHGRVSDLATPAASPAQGLGRRHVSAAGSASPPLLPTAHRNHSHPIHLSASHAMTGGLDSPDPRSAFNSFSVTPRSSGQNYDPVRSTTIETPVSLPGPQLPSMINRNTYSPPPSTATPPPRAQFRASASPAISSIIDPPAPTASNSTASGLPQKSVPASVAPSPKPATEPATSISKQERDIKENAKEEAKPAPQNKGTSGAPSTGGASSPKPARKEKEPPRPTGPGSGLLTNALFGVTMGPTEKDERTAPNIVLHIPLKGQNNKIVSFARMAEEKYGFDALNPRVAAQRARRAEIDAASTALAKNEKNAKGDSGAEEDLSLDGEKDSDADGDVVMSGTANAEANGEKEDTTVRKRRRKMEDYDRDDPFVDDSELVWEEQAATSKDGFFVYSGPLVPVGEKVTVERYVQYFPLSLMSNTNPLLEPTAPSNAVAAVAAVQPPHRTLTDQPVAAAAPALLATKTRTTPASATIPTRTTRLPTTAVHLRRAVAVAVEARRASLALRKLIVRSWSARRRRGRRLGWRLLRGGMLVRLELILHTYVLLAEVEDRQSGCLLGRSVCRVYSVRVYFHCMVLLLLFDSIMEKDGCGSKD